MPIRKIAALGMWGLAACCLLNYCGGDLRADEPKNPADPSAELKRLMPNYDVWVDFKNKQVILQGDICLTRGALEMFAVTKGTKEHESVVSVNTKAYVVHAALLALGAEPGTTVKYEPKFAPPTGTKVEIMAYWMDDKGDQHKARAQDWVRDVKTKKPMAQSWVFAGSGFYVDEATKQRYYMAEAGDFICVSNFPDAMLDVPVESTSDNDDLLFEAFTENIPPKGTKVTLVLMPQIEKQKSGDKKSDGAEKTSSK
ncbi:MAG TPA: YdjY domain-containing protein [Pirellulales bacterium]|jgi:hypothetical protein|nr:YdjY domain-containing protein [Pirellulales bacterium]